MKEIEIKDENPTPAIIILLAILALILVIQFLSTQLVKTMLAGNDTSDNIKIDTMERDGVLYYPDGQPVRNYEQLYVYINSNE
jgi:hypothetical protein